MRHVSRYLPYLIAVVIGILVFGVSLWLIIQKSSTFSYNALDLGIYRQVVDHTARGDFFGFTIHPHSYLGDHIEPLLVLLAPVTLVFPSAVTLPVVQLLVLLSGAVPLLMLVRRRLRNPLIRSAILAGFLLLPFVHNAALFEFHMLTFALPLLLWAIVYYDRKRFIPFFFFLIATLLAREDLGLVLMGFGILAWIDRRSMVWRVTPIVVGALWFVAATWMTSLFNADQYKFLAYYGWLGTSFGSLLIHALTQPWRIVLQLMRFQNVLFVFMLAVVTVGLPLYRKRVLAPAIFLLLALFLTSFGADAVTLRTHYPIVVVPFLMWGVTEGLARLTERPARWMHQLVPLQASVLAALLFVLVSLYGALTFGPLRPAAVRAMREELLAPKTTIAHRILDKVPNDAHVAASYRFLPPLATRPALYSLHYGFQGRRQLSSVPYRIPDDTDAILYDARDYLYYTVQYQDDGERFSEGDERFRELFLDRGLRVRYLADSFVLLDADGGGPALYTIEAESNEHIMAHLGPITVRRETDTSLNVVPFELDPNIRLIPLTLTWSTERPLDRTYHLRLQFVDVDGAVVHEQWYPIAYGLYPTTEWRVGEFIRVPYAFAVPRLDSGSYTLRMQLATLTAGFVSLDPKLTATVQVTGQEMLGEPVDLGTFSL